LLRIELLRVIFLLLDLIAKSKRKSNSRRIEVVASRRLIFGQQPLAFDALEWADERRVPQADLPIELKVEPRKQFFLQQERRVPFAVVEAILVSWPQVGVELVGGKQVGWVP